MQKQAGDSLDSESDMALLCDPGSSVIGTASTCDECPAGEWIVVFVGSDNFITSELITL